MVCANAKSSASSRSNAPSFSAAAASVSTPNRSIARTKSDAYDQRSAINSFTNTKVGSLTPFSNTRFTSSDLSSVLRDGSVKARLSAILESKTATIESRSVETLEMLALSRLEIFFSNAARAAASDCRLVPFMASVMVTSSPPNLTQDRSRIVQQLLIDGLGHRVTHQQF